MLYKEDGIDPDSHEARREFVETKWYLRGIRNEYKGLKDYSEDARYKNQKHKYTVEIDYRDGFGVRYCA